MLVLEAQIREAIERLSSETKTPGRAEVILWRFVKFLKDRGVTSLGEVTANEIVGFMFRQGPNDGMSRDSGGDRWSVMEWLFSDRAEELGKSASRWMEDPIPGSPTRALTNEEMRECQRKVLPGVSAARVALAQTAMSPGEVCDIPVSALDDPNKPTEVKWPDKHGVERIFVLTEWGRYAVRTRVDRVGGDPEAFVAYDGQAAPGSAARRSAASKDLRKVLDKARLDFHLGVRPKSISYWGGLVCRERGDSPETVARLLGVRTENLPRFLA